MDDCSSLGQSALCTAQVTTVLMLGQWQAAGDEHSAEDQCTGR